MVTKEVVVVGRMTIDATATTSEVEGKVAKAVAAMMGETKADSVTIGKTNSQSYLKVGRLMYHQTNSH